MKLAALIGAAVGLPLLPVALLVGFVTGGVIASGALLLRLKERKDLMPFGPFLAGGAIVALLAGESLFDWYVNLLS